MRTPLNTFYNMKQRCYNPNDKKYKCYGGKNILICDKWLKNPVSFITWAEQNGWSCGKHIHRMNNLKGYSPENCEWLSVEQHRKKHPATTTRLNVSVPKDLLPALDKEAKKEGRSRSNLVSWLLERAMKELVWRKA